MVENKTTGSRRRRRSTAVLERLEAARQRRVEQLERERENERRVDAALGPFAEAATAIEGVERRREGRVAALERQLERKLAELDRQRAAKVAEAERLAEQVRADAEMEIAEWRAVMATSVAQIRAADVGAAETAALLGIPAKMVAALSRQATEVAGAAQHAEGEPGKAPATMVAAGDDESRAPDEVLADPMEREGRMGDSGVSGRL
ncbi:hypothetical protein VA596_47485 [Amycolatopsis sp., V23-08]|uniref:Uncharacterized protein n=1 Tax=Amycolatopsis heterodermiae TaxID=3110235 RepID=A0ABU5RLR8_9PSEU|nr:hypothetical protein [Amycolatopsis sp., V23-08]MEA5367243.1 hypothetical protein [Amycolatopsis sp., V23-08]